MQTTRSDWLAAGLQQLMAAPHVHLSDDEALGPGPVDLFSTTFDALFAPDARGWVCGDRADRQELKESLLGLQRRWNDKEARCVGVEPADVAGAEFHVSARGFVGKGRLTEEIECTARPGGED